MRQQALQAPHGTSAGTSSRSVASVASSQAPNAGRLRGHRTRSAVTGRLDDGRRDGGVVGPGRGGAARQEDVRDPDGEHGELRRVLRHLAAGERRRVRRDPARGGGDGGLELGVLGCGQVKRQRRARAVISSRSASMPAAANTRQS